MHTPGPLEVVYAHGYAIGVGHPIPNNGYEVVANTITEVDDESDVPRIEQQAKLLAASYTSYDRHCGQKSIELAEGDLLGQLITACKVLLADWEARQEVLMSIEPDFREVVGTLLSKLPQPNGESQP